MVCRSRKHLLIPVLLIAVVWITATFAVCVSPALGMATGRGVIGEARKDPTQVVDLKHSPVGKADVVWIPGSQALEVIVAVSGLAPNSEHPMHIHQGTCAQGGSVVYPLSPLMADAQGNATTTTFIQNVVSDIPAGWSINIHNGPQMSSELQNRAIACGDVTHILTTANGVETAHIAFAGITAPDENVTGQATMAFAGGQLHVVLRLRGLVPGSTHIAHLHAGRCEKQGPVAYPLTSVVTNGYGYGTSSTTIALSSIPTGQFYINVHEAGTMTGPDGLGTSQGFNPIACGNI
jgi:hypothetical protein